MNVRTLVVSAAVGVAAMMAQSPTAHALNFFYSFSNVTGNVAGTVSGEVFGLIDNSISGATDISVTSFPAGLTGLPAAPFSIFAYSTSLGQTVGANSFTVTSGVITDVAFQVGGGYFDLNAFNVFNELVNPPQTLFVQNLDGLGGVTFSPAPSTVPLPSTWVLLITGLAGLGGMAYRGSKQQSAPLRHV